MAQPLWENANFANFLKRCFYSPQRLVFYLHRPQTPFLALFRQKWKREKMTNFFPLEKRRFCDFLKSVFLQIRKASSQSKTSPNIFTCPFFAKNEKKKKFQIFDQNHGLTLLEKCKFCDFFKSTFLQARTASLLSKTSPNTFSRLILPKKKKKKKFQIFDQNHGLPPLGKCKFCDFLKPMFLQC